MSKVSQIKALCFQLAPKVVQNRLYSYAENKRIAHWQECFKTKVSQEDIDNLFFSLALNSDVMIHSSLPDLGNIKLKHVTDNLKRYVLDSGHTILCPALPIKGSSLDYLKSIRTFDVRTAPNAMGAISCYYERQEESLRSLSPTHSVVAFGERSEYYTKEHHVDETPFTEKSPYFKIMANKGKILMLGASLKNLTFNHVIEDMIGEESFPVRVYDTRRFEIELIDKLGTKQKGSFRAHSSRSGRMRDSVELMRMVRELPSTRVFPIGCGEVLLLDAMDVCLCLLTQLKNGLTTMGHRRVSEECRHKANTWINIIQQP